VSLGNEALEKVLKKELARDVISQVGPFQKKGTPCIKGSMLRNEHEEDYLKIRIRRPVGSLNTPRVPIPSQ
jgi:hypothetical protein